MSKKYHNSMLLEEAKDDARKSKKLQQARTSTNEATFKTPSTQVTPTKNKPSGTNGSGSKDGLNTSAVSSKQPQTQN